MVKINKTKMKMIIKKFKIMKQMKNKKLQKIIKKNKKLVILVFKIIGMNN